MCKDRETQPKKGEKLAREREIQIDRERERERERQRLILFKHTNSLINIKK